MSVDYQKIRKENERKYGTEVQHYGKTLSGLHPGRTHFIYEVLQNTEDALKKRGDEGGSRAIDFSLEAGCLIISHYGKPFDEADVRGICSIARSTKEEMSSIGRFGIGFKSVYTFTHRPEIHSGDERFAIESFVFPHLVNERALNPGETKIIIPFDKELADGGPPMEQVRSGLKKLRPRTLLFLQQITKITWSVNGIRDGIYWRQNLEQLTEEACKVRVGDSAGLAEDWIVFAREVFNEGKSAGYIELAFALESQSGDGHKLMVQRLKENPTLVVFLPTELKTDLGFIVQGPYHTTPSRESIQQGDAWNQSLIEATAVLLVDALEGLRDLGLLGVSALESLPLDEGEFAEGSLFAPLFQAVKDALLNKPLLPAHNGGHIAGKNAKLGTEILRGLITSEQLAELLQTKSAPGWINADVTLGNAPDLYNYLKNDEDGLGIDELYAHWLIGKLTTEFMARQTDDWVEKLYEGLNRSWTRKVPENVKKTPLLRLQQDDPHKDPLHTTAVDDNGNLQVYLPKSDGTRTGFATIKAGVCKSDEALSFLKSLGLREPDPVDNVIKNILPKYSQKGVYIPDEQEYESDIERIVAALATDSTSQRNNLVSRLREAKFVAAVDAGTRVSRFVTPREAYIPTEQLRRLFEGVNGVLLVDNSRDYLGEQMLSLLRTVGTPKYLLPVRIESSLTEEDKREFRCQQGDERWFGNKEVVEDYTLMGLDALLEALSDLPHELVCNRPSLLWEALCDAQANRSDLTFYGSYRWVRYSRRSHSFPARFVKTLRESAWVPDKDGKLSRPAEVVFQDTGWEENSFLNSIIEFKSVVINIKDIAKEAGIDPGTLELLKKNNISESELRELLKLRELVKQRESRKLRKPRGWADDKDAPDSPEGGQKRKLATNSGKDVVKPPTGYREFVTYVKVDPKESDEDPDGLTHKARMDLESRAIAFIRDNEPDLERATDGNRGYDLWELDRDGKPVKYIEVKAMSGTFENRPATLSKTQFEFAQEHQNDFWLYVVENAGDPAQRNLVRIKDPAGKAQTFTFDRGWRELQE